jgi:hypothetical protein
MKKRNLVLGVGLLTALMGIATSGNAATMRDDCRADPPAVAPDNSPEAPSDVAGQTLSDQLASCGSVLDPPPVGDPDIVEPTPPVDDPINIYPTPPDAIRP